jgi:CheY-like chemotaxis protein
MPIAEAETAGHTVLVVDDEEDLREVMRRMLQRQGFATLTAADPNEAVTMFRDHQDEIDLLLTDLGMPNASGQELARLALSMRPGLRVLYVSGLPKAVAVAKGLVGEADPLVQKPFTSERLTEAVRRALE